VDTTCLIPQRRPDPRELAGPEPMLSKNRSSKRTRTFRALFCQKFSYPHADFERQLFSRCLYRHARTLAPVLSKMDPDFFREDFSFIADLATASTHAEVRMELDRFRGRNLRDRNWLRKNLSLRISGKRVLHLSRKLFASQP
jgi:hypothetical protein